jgi:valyl-tRNA synthetase
MIEMDKIYDHIKSEKQAQDLWENNKTYTYKDNPAQKTFSIDTPPPTVSGTLHIGHIFSYTHADLIARYKRMQGFNVFYPMGFDDNGLPTERFVEKTHSTKAHLMKRSDFIALCLKETQNVEKLFENLWRKIGLSVDWNNVYSTISDPVRRVSQYSFIDLYNKGLVYRKNEPSLFCTTCRTSVAQAELDSAEVSTAFNNIIFTTEGGEKLTIATTRPELLPACVAIFFHPDDSRYKHLSGSFATTPVFEQVVRIMADDKVDPAKGTGLVMCCTFGDQTDIYWYKTYKLPFKQVVGFDGKWTQISGPLAGLTVHEARKKTIELLKETNTLVEQKSITHSVNTHERCKQEIEYLELPQWFIKILDHKEAFLKRADQINWNPSFMKSRYLDWVQNLHWDWCISRQRFFGIPFPVWHCQDCGHTILADIKDLPIDPQERAYPGGSCPKCSSTKLQPETDVMDTWNTSSLTPQINIGWPDKSPNNLSLPMSMRPQAHDIIRTWAFYTIIKAHFHDNNVPWNDIMISGHVLAGKEKISKSKENSKMSPEELLKQFPADVIRYWSANGRLGTDTAFSENQLKIGQRLVTKLWNAFRFISEHLQQYEFREIDSTDALNQWIMHSFSQTYAQYQKHFDAYEYQAALETVERFFWQNFCDNYLELVKDKLFNPTNYTVAEVEEAKYVLHHIGFGLLQLFAPFLPNITETLYQTFYRSKENVTSLHITQFDNKRFTCNFEQSNQIINTILAVVSAVRKLKSEHQLSLKTDLAKLIIYNPDQKIIDAIKTQQTLISGITKAQAIEYTATDLAESSLVKQDEMYVAQVKA